MSDEPGFELERVSEVAGGVAIVDGVIWVGLSWRPFDGGDERGFCLSCDAAERLAAELLGSATELRAAQEDAASQN